MGTVFESKLVAAFKFFDLDGDGTINHGDLVEICKQLDPQNWTDEKVNSMLKTLDKRELGYVDYSEFVVWVTSGMLEGGSVMGIFENAAAKMPGDRLGDGDLTDAGLVKMRTYLNNALDISPTHYATPKATTKLMWLRDIAELLDPMQHPGSYRLCQNALVERGAIGPLLGLAQKAQTDGVIVKSLEVLARTAFGNIEAATAVASCADFLPTLRVVLTDGKQPAKLTALQLAQAIAASSAAPQIQEMLPDLLAEVSPLLADKNFMVLPQAAFDVMVSISFGAPAAIVGAVPWAEVACWLAESGEQGRPAWLGADNLMVLACGLLASNVLALPTPAFTSNDELDARRMVHKRLGASDFLDCFVHAMEAAVTQREWPAYSGAYHSVRRLASVVPVLASLGFRRQLDGVVAPLAKAVEEADEHTTVLALLALRRLVDDFVCLEKFLTLRDFRSDTLEVLHRAGDEQEATDLTSCTTAGENALAAAQSSFEEAKDELTDPPSVRALAELFNEYSPMDGELNKDQLLDLLPKVPIGPGLDVEVSLGVDKTSKFDFAAFTQRVYGTPTLLGWWPNLMDDVSAMWSKPSFQELQPPPLTEMLFHYQLSAKGSSGVTCDAIFHNVLPALNQPLEGNLVEELFAEIRGDSPLGFKEFAAWMQKYFQAVHQQHEEAQ